jgi:hypothetical protein
MRLSSKLLGCSAWNIPVVFHDRSTLVPSLANWTLIPLSLEAGGYAGELGFNRFH